MQVALNNAPGGNSLKNTAVSSARQSLFKPSCPCLKKPNKIDARSASDLMYAVEN
jgi:hypothetical protein